MEKEKGSLRGSVEIFIKRKYRAEPEYLWMRFPNYAVFRHSDNRKWFGPIMDLPFEKLGLRGEGRVDVLNVKLSPHRKQLHDDRVCPGEAEAQAAQGVDSPREPEIL